MAKDIVLFGLNSRSNTIQESSVIIIIMDAATTADIIVNIVIMDEVSVVNDSCTWRDD